MQEPPRNVSEVTIKRHHGRWEAIATWYVGPFRHTRTATRDTYEEAYTAVALPLPGDTEGVSISHD